MSEKINTHLHNKLPWIEKYRPSTFEQIISQKKIVNTLQNFIRNKNIPHLLLFGPPGTGKTSIITVCAKELYKDDYNTMVLEINASEERGIEIVRTRITQFVTSKNIFSSNPNMFKLVILDEADAMTPDAQAMLRRVIEKYTGNIRFCLICNYIKKINIALQSRCTKFRFPPLSEKNIRTKIKEIIKSEAIRISSESITTIIQRGNGDMRKVLNILQSINMAYRNTLITTKIISTFLGYPDHDKIHKLFDSLKTQTLLQSYELLCEYKKYYSVSDIIAELYTCIMSIINSSRDYEMQIKYLKIINLMANVEYDIISCTSDTIQMCSMIGIFKYTLNT